MVVQKFLKRVLPIFFLISILNISFINASAPSLQFYPQSGVIKDPEEGFTVDVLINSGEYKLAKARMAFSFDPSLIQIREASKNNTLFMQWPEDESSLDNENGLVMLTGFTQSGAGELYQTSGDPDVFARVEFDVLTEDQNAEILLKWEFSGSDDPFKSALLVDGSPPQNILIEGGTDADNNLKDGRYSIGRLVQTSIGPEYIPFILGGILILFAGVIISSKQDITRKKHGTVVIYAEE